MVSLRALHHQEWDRDTGTPTVTRSLRCCVGALRSFHICVDCKTGCQLGCADDWNHDLFVLCLCGKRRLLFVTLDHEVEIEKQADIFGFVHSWQMSSLSTCLQAIRAMRRVSSQATVGFVPQILFVWYDREIC